MRLAPTNGSSSGRRVMRLLIVLMLAAPLCFAGEATSFPPEFRPMAKEAQQRFECGEFAQAEAIYADIVKQHPKSVSVISNLGVVRLRLGEFKAAEDAMRRAVALAPQDKFCQRALGIILERQGLHKRAAEHSQMAGDAPPAKSSTPVNIPISIA